MDDRMVILASGETIEEMSNLVALEKNLPEWTEVELRLNMRWRWPGFETSISGLNTLLVSAGVDPWRGKKQIAYVDPTEPVVYLRWTKGNPWLGIILRFLGPWLLALVGFGAILLMGWTFFQKTLEQIPELIRKNPVIALVGALGALFIITSIFNRPAQGAVAYQLVKAP